MAMYGNGLWLAEQNTKIPAISHVLSFRVQLSAANTTQTVAIPQAITNPAQAVFPGIQPTGQPQQGRRLFVTEMVVRDANGPIGGTAGGSVALQDTTQSLTVAQVASSTSAGANPPYSRASVTAGTAVVNPNDNLAVVYTAPTTASSTTGTAFTVDVFGYWQQGV
jgi:hypothetical protein